MIRATPTFRLVMPLRGGLPEVSSRVYGVADDPHPSQHHMKPTYDLERFVDAQVSVYPRVLAELQRGEKTSHWMWFIFPQIAGLGQSTYARKFAISSLDEASQYLQHPLLGARLLKCARLVLGVKGKTAVGIFQETDAMKLRSSATLFAQVSPAGSVFHRIVDQYFDGKPDAVTLNLLTRA